MKKMQSSGRFTQWISEIVDSVPGFTFGNALSGILRLLQLLAEAQLKTAYPSSEPARRKSDGIGAAAYRSLRSRMS